MPPRDAYMLSQTELKGYQCPEMVKQKLSRSEQILIESQRSTHVTLHDLALWKI